MICYCELRELGRVGKKVEWAFYAGGTQQAITKSSSRISQGVNISYHRRKLY